MAYCAISDLLIGDLPISDLIDKQTFVDDAADEIDAAIGSLYTTPVVTTSLANHVKALLKRINSHLATGRLIATIAIGAEDMSVHAYASMLIKESQDLIWQIANGQIKLTGADTVVDSSATDTGVRVKNYDELSAVDQFSGYFMGGASPQEGNIWRPGAVT